MSEFKVSTDMFGKYAMIPTDFSAQEHIYKIVKVFESNTWCEVPIKYNSEPVLHNEMQTVLNVIHCGLDETKVVRVALKDCRIVEPKIRTQFDRIKAMPVEELAEAMLKIKDINELIPFCGKSTRCDDILDAGELVPEEMCRQCMVEWLQSEVEE